MLYVMHCMSIAIFVKSIWNATMKHRKGDSIIIIKTAFADFMSDLYSVSVLLNCLPRKGLGLCNNHLHIATDFQYVPSWSRNLHTST